MSGCLWGEDSDLIQIFNTMIITVPYDFVIIFQFKSHTKKKIENVPLFYQSIKPFNAQAGS